MRQALSLHHASISYQCLLTCITGASMSVAVPVHVCLMFSVRVVARIFIIWAHESQWLTSAPSRLIKSTCSSQSWATMTCFCWQRLVASMLVLPGLNMPYSQCGHIYSSQTMELWLPIRIMLVTIIASWHKQLLACLSWDQHLGATYITNASFCLCAYCRPATLTALHIGRRQWCCILPVLSFWCATITYLMTTNFIFLIWFRLHTASMSTNYVVVGVSANTSTTLVGVSAILSSVNNPNRLEYGSNGNDHKSSCDYPLTGSQWCRQMSHFMKTSIFEAVVQHFGDASKLPVIY